MSALLGKKVGMTGVFDEAGEYIPVTVVELGPNYVTQIKTKAVDGYDAVQLGFSEKAEKNVNSPGKGHFEKSGSPMLRYVNEIRSFDDAKVAELKPGAVLNAADIFNEGDTIHVVSLSLIHI